MGTFKFRLATFLQLREFARDERRRALGEAFGADEVLQRQTLAAQQEMEALQADTRRAGAPGAIDVDHLIEAKRYEIEMFARLQLLGHKRALLTAEIERRRLALVDANRDVRVLEQLREKQIEHFRDTENLAQIKMLDETAQRRITDEETPS
jgi:flagellar export protein FliJ